MHVWIGLRLCTNQLKALSPPPPHLRQPTGIWLSSMPKGEEFGPWMGGGGKFKHEWSSISSWINVFYLLTWRCWKVKSSLLLVDGSEEKAYKKARVTNLPSTKRRSNLALGWGIWTQFWSHGGWNLNQPNYKSLNAWGLLGWGGGWGGERRVWSFKLTDALCCGK